MVRSIYFLLCLLLFSCKQQSQDTNIADPVVFSQSITPYPEIKEDALSLSLDGYAKVFCSALYVSGRDAEEAFHNSGYFLLPEAHQDEVKYIIDESDKSVRLTLRDSISAKAKYYGDQGCIICKNGVDKIYFEPEAVTSSLPPADETPWPMGDKIESEPTEPTLDPTLLEEAVDLAFTPEESLTAAYIVLHKGNIVAEKYMPGINKNTQLESWSMGKSLTATLIGRMIHQGYFKLDDRAPVDIWSDVKDPRYAITIRDLLQMSGGLKFTAHRDPEAGERESYLDHFYIYTGAIDAFSFSINRPLEFPVGSTGRYRNCDPMSLGYVMKTTLEKKGISYLNYPQEALFDKIGIRKQVLETDPYGNFLLSGYDYGTARNWARLGLLYLQDGMMNGERLLPEGWADFVSSHAPGWKEPVYGGMFWLNGTGEAPIPKNSYSMAGAGGQRTIIIPDYDLVVVRMGHFRGAELGGEALNRSLAKLMEAVK